MCYVFVFLLQLVIIILMETGPVGHNNDGVIRARQPTYLYDLRICRIIWLEYVFSFFFFLVVLCHLNFGCVTSSSLFCLFVCCCTEHDKTYRRACVYLPVCYWEYIDNGVNQAGERVNGSRPVLVVETAPSYESPRGELVRAVFY